MKDQEYKYELNGKVYTIHGKPGLTLAELKQIVTGRESGDWFDKYGRGLMTAGGAGIGMIAAAPAAAGATVGTAGLATPGAIALEAGAAGLGAGMGGQAYDLIQNLRGRGRQGETIISKGKQVLGDVASNAIAAPAGRALGEALEIGGRAVAPYVAPRAQAALEFLTAKSAPGIKAVRARATGLLESESAQAAAARAEALKRAEALRANATADTARAAGFERKAAKATVKAQPPSAGIGQVKTLSERGAPVREAAVAQRNKIYENQVAQDKILRGAADQVVADNEAAGRFITDIPSAKELMGEVSGRLSPDPVKSPTATSLPSPEESKVLSAVQTAMRDRRVVLSDEEAAAASRAGIPLEKVNGQYIRTFKTSFEALDNLRRRLGESFNGVPTGFEGIPNHLARDMYGKVSRVLDDYVGAARAEVQANWKNGLQALEPYDNTKVGKTLTGTQGETGIPGTTASQIPGKIVSGGREGVEQVKALAGEEVGKQFTRNQVQSVLTKANGEPLPYDEAVEKVGHNSQLRDAINADPELARAVDQHLQRLLDAKTAGVQAEKFKGFGQARVKAAEAAKTEEKAAISAAGEAEKTGLSAIADIEQLRIAKPENVLSQANQIATRMFKEGKMSQDEFTSFMNDISQTEKTKGIEAAKNRALKWFLLASGGATGVTIGAEKAGNALKRTVRSE